MTVIESKKNLNDTNNDNDIHPSKIIPPSSSLVELTLIEYPFFLFSQKPKLKLQKSEIDYDTYMSSIEHDRLSAIEKEKAELFRVSFKEEDGKFYKHSYGENKIIDYYNSSNAKVKFEINSLGPAPREFEFMVYIAMIRLFIMKNGPFNYSVKEKRYLIRNRKLYFSIYELASIMKINPTGQAYKRIKQAILTLRYTEYAANEVFYIARNKSYMSKDKSITLITEYEFNSRFDAKGQEIKGKKNSKATNYVTLSDYFLDNIEFEYFKYINDEIFFDKLKTGLERKMYLYIERNKYDKNRKPLQYIVRFYETLQCKIPIEYKYISRLKIKLKPVLDKLKFLEIIKDYIFGDEIVINGRKEEKLYICLTVTSEELLNKLKEESTKGEQLQLQFDISSNLDEEIKAIGVNEAKIPELLKKYDKWYLITYIMFFKKVKIQQKKKINNPAGLFLNALELDLIRSQNSHQYDDILQYIDSEKKKENKEEEELQLKVKKQYEEYVNRSINDFKEDSVFEYEIEKAKVLKSLNDSINSRIDNAKKSITILKSSGGDITKTEESLREMEEFLVKKEKSNLFIRELNRSINLYLKLDDFDTFVIKNK